MNKEITFIGFTTFRNELRKFGIKLDDRRRHMYIIGKTGMGKTELLKNLAIYDILRGNGIGFIDPHGEAADDLLNYVPPERIKDVVYFNPGDTKNPIAFNVMEKVSPEERHLIASGLMGVFKKIWPDVWSARMEYILNNAILALLEYPGSTLLGVNRMLSDIEYRKKVIDKVTDPVIKSFWVNEFARYALRYETEATAAIQNKVGQFISNPLIRNIIGQIGISVDIRKLMDQGKILIANLSKGKIGEDNSTLLGALLITKLQQAAMSRIDTPEAERKDFYLYVDEFQNFATEAFINILSEARKYRLCLTLSHQYIEQMVEEVRDAVFGNVGTITIFRIGAQDAEFLEKEFSPIFTPENLVNLGKYHIYIKLMIDGLASKPFSAITLPPWQKFETSYKAEIIEFSAQKYGTPREKVEEEISAWVGALEPREALALQEPSAPTELYDVLCFHCSKKIKVPFLPEPERPVYCKSCIKKMEKEKIIEETPALSLEELLTFEPVSFKKDKEKKSQEEKDKSKKEVNIGELQKVLEEVLEERSKRNKKREKRGDARESQEPQKNQKNNEKGTIEPGETVKF